jgi:hypothetical protein
MAFGLSIAALVHLVERLTGLAFPAVGSSSLRWRPKRLSVGS